MFEIKIYYRNTPEEDLIQDLKNVSSNLCKNPITRSDYEAHGKFSATTMCRRFGSWSKALSKAGLKPSAARFNIPEEKLLDNIKDVWIKLGRQPKYDEMRVPLSKYSASTYGNRFGSWGGALERFIQFVNENDEPDPTEFVESLPAEARVAPRKTKRDISDRLRFRVLMRDGFTCQSCGASPIKSRDVKLHVDHILPWSKGGETEAENLQTKCKQCNLGKGNVFDK